METVAALLVLAGLVGGGYVVWRLVRRGRDMGDPAGHPRLRVIGVASIAALVVGSLLTPAPAEETAETESAEQQRSEAEQARQEAEARERAEEARRARAEEARREREAAERRRRAEQGKTALVTRVIDGDTVELQGVGRVRLTGVDTPERGEECYDEATAYLRGRVGGKTVRYRYQKERTDRYDRALLDLFRGGELVNLDIAEAGWGEELTIQPNDRYAQRIAEAEAEARAAGRGRWGGCIEEPEPRPAPQPEREPAPSPSDDDDGGGSGGGGGGGSVPDGTCDEIGMSDFPVPPGDPRDRDGDGIACES